MKQMSTPTLKEQVLRKIPGNQHNSTKYVSESFPPLGGAVLQLTGKQQTP